MTDASYKWVVLAAGGLIGCVAMGMLFSLPVFLDPLTSQTQWSRTGVSSAMTLAFLVMGFAGFGWGALSDRIGPVLIVMTGSLVLTIGLYLLSLVNALWQFQAIFGFVLAIAVAAFLAPMMACVTGWFTSNRGLAVSLVSAGIGLAPMTMSPLVAWLLETYEWRTCYQIMALIALGTTLPLSFLIRRPLPDEALAPSSAAALSSSRGLTARQALMSRPFMILAITNFFCCATHSGPIFHTVSYAISCGIPVVTAVTIYSVEGLAGMGGRIGFGLAGDRFGAKRMLVAGLMAQAIGAMGYYYAHSLTAFYSAAIVFGFVYAGIMPLYAVLIRENFPQRIMGALIGGTGLAGSLGMATGPVLGGWIYDQTGAYGGLYIACAVLGLCAMAIATTFRPVVAPPGAAATI